MKIDLTQLTALHAEHEQKIARPTARKPGDWYNIVPRGESTTIYMYAEIGGFYGVTAAEFVNELSQIKSSNIDLRINSLGGEIFEGVAIMAAIANHPAYVTGYVDGIAASAASFILMACDKIIMNPAATMMVHDGQGITAGDEAAHLASATILGKLSDTIAEVYARRAGGTPEEWRARMLAETWFNATEAKASGLVDEVGTESVEPEEPAMRAEYDLSIFRNYSTPKAPDVSEADVTDVVRSASTTPTDDIEPETVPTFDTRAFQMALLAAGLTGA